MLPAENLTEGVIGLAIEVHRHTGPGLLESVYERCLCHELTLAGVFVARQVVLEIKAVPTILPAHEAQLQT